MAVFKCKMCGGDLNIHDGMTVCECEFCGTTQTIPSSDDERKTNLFNRANHLRRNNEFDRALGLYESIIADFPNDAEAYWGLLLCKFGIEYVDDPLTGRKIATCHRTSYESILNDENYKKALEYGDSVARSVYAEEANYIDEVQKGILKIANSEKPYDVFICYKETDELGERTQDSVYAQDIYDNLTEKGMKVFFARITLEDKLGRAYEPYIFAALNSAKVMIVLGSKIEYFNAVWVKNEWMRYLALMKKNKEKVLIPVYKNIDPYDLPEAMAMLQAQDMSKIGFMQDLVRGIKKVVGADAERPVQPVVQPIIQQSAPASANIENLLKRGMLSLEDGKWEDADKFFEDVLNENVEEPRAYLGKLMANLKYPTEKYFETGTDEFGSNENYLKVQRFGDENIKTKLNNYYRQSVYNRAAQYVNSAKNIRNLETARDTYLSIKEFKDAQVKADACESAICFVQYKEIFKIIKKADECARTNFSIAYKLYSQSAEQLRSISNFANTEYIIEKCTEKAEKCLQLQKNWDTNVKQVNDKISEKFDASINSLIAQKEDEIRPIKARLKELKDASTDINAKIAFMSKFFWQKNKVNKLKEQINEINTEIEKITAQDTSSEYDKQIEELRKNKRDETTKAINELYGSIAYKNIYDLFDSSTIADFPIELREKIEKFNNEIDSGKLSDAYKPKETGIYSVETVNNKDKKENYEIEPVSFSINKKGGYETREVDAFLKKLNLQLQAYKQGQINKSEIDTKCGFTFNKKGGYAPKEVDDYIYSVITKNKL